MCKTKINSILFYRSRFRWRLHPLSVSGDAAYGTRENITTIEKAGIRAYLGMPNREFSRSGTIPGSLLKFVCLSGQG